MFSFLGDNTQIHHVKWLNGDVWEIELTPFNYTGKEDEIFEILNERVKEDEEMPPMRKHRTHLTEIEQDEKGWLVTVDPPCPIQPQEDEKKLLFQIHTVEELMDHLDWWRGKRKNEEDEDENQEGKHTKDVNIEVQVKCTFNHMLNNFIHILCTQYTCSYFSLVFYHSTRYDVSQFQIAMPSYIDSMHNVFGFYTNIPLDTECLARLSSNPIRVLLCPLDDQQMIREDWKQALDQSSLLEITLSLGWIPYVHVSVFIQHIRYWENWEYNLVFNNGIRRIHLTRRNDEC